MAWSKERTVEKIGSIEALASKAKELNEQKIPWHWHYLPRECDINYTGGYVVLIATEDKTYTVHSEIEPEREQLRIIDGLYFDRP